MELLAIMKAQKGVPSKMMGNSLNMATLRVDIEDAKEAGDYQKAAAIIEEGLTSVGRDVRDVLNHSSLFSCLAEVKQLDGNNEDADISHKNAIAKAEELIELNEGEEYTPLGFASFAYAKFLVDIERYGEAEKYFLLALDMETKSNERFAIRFQRPAPVPSSTEASIKSALANVMRCTDRVAESLALEAEAAEINRQVEEYEQTRKNKPN